MSAPRERLQSRHWFGKTCAGVVLGFGLALATSGLFAWLGPGGIDGGGGKIQFVMWWVSHEQRSGLQFSPGSKAILGQHDRNHGFSEVGPPRLARREGMKSESPVAKLSG